MAYYPEIQTASVTLSTAQMKNLASAPITVIPALAGSFIHMRSYVLYYHAGTQGFNPGAHDVISLTYGNPTNLAKAMIQEDGTPYCTGFIDQTVDMVRYAFPVWGFSFTNQSGPGMPTTNIVGQPVQVLQFDNSQVSFPVGTNWTQGNGSLEVIVRYVYAAG